MTKRILVIDDDHAVRDAFELALDDPQYTVEVAENGEIGVEKVTAQKPDLVFLDLKMPKMDGVDVLNKLHDIAPTVPVYIVTAFHQEFFDRLNEAMEAGISFELARKPLSGAEIRTITAATLG